VLFHRNPYMLYWFRGRAVVEQVITAHALPHLHPVSYEALRPLLSRVRVLTGNIEQVLQREPVGRFNKANLSDIFEYMSEAESSALFGQLGDRLRAGGRFVYWNMLVKRAATAHDSPRLRPLHAEAERLHLIDRLFVYSAFHIEETHSS
jgi:S-adenosylmethionine-diacylglycerol 3-amino-3-carboxypropyl transferase